MEDLVAEILVIGNELLIGKIIDTNGKWLIDHLIPYGIKISRVTIIMDDLDEISSSIREILSRKPDFVFTSGGLGPTFDDMTIQGISIGLGIEQTIEINEKALNWLKERYEYALKTKMVNYSPETTVDTLLNTSRKKMAYVPRPAIPLRNTVGAAPGIKFPKEITNNHTVIYSLPGVPPELKAIYNEEILPEIINCAKGHKFTQAKMVFEEVGESNLSGFINSIKEEYSKIWIKTHPHFRLDKETGHRQYFVELHLTSFDCDNERIIELMDELLNKIEDDVVKIGGKILSKEYSTQTKIV